MKFEKKIKKLRNNIIRLILPTSYLQANLRYTGASDLQARATVDSQLFQRFSYLLKYMGVQTLKDWGLQAFCSNEQRG